ncbi:SusD/RagB family nutrient-binding outer membrane lipoprotein [Pedobacter sp.]|uniref:SusD/RagB family nutrient-binding outer membrane lipoprotein n=1 Tax=Pedobacter sp. TaxID=1411316 RepID=UPI003D7F416E
MKKIIFPIFTLMLLVATSCKKEFFDINENPNSPTEQSITPALLLPRTLHNVGVRTATGYDYAAMWMGYWSRSGTYGQTVEPESYAITTTYQAGQWNNTSNNGWYDILTDANLMEKKAVVSGQTFYEAAAKTIKAIGFMYLVDQYNNVPYSKAFDFQGNILPAYDKGADIYADLLVQLDAAAKLFATAEVNDDIKKADIVFGGNTTLWRKLVNTQRLKLLIHESQVVTSATVTDVVSKITADGSGFLATGETASVKAGYAISDGQQNPFWNTYKVSALGVLDNYNRANNFVLNKYRSPGNAAFEDIRYQYIFSKAAIPVAGNTYYGYNYGENLPNTDPYKAANSSDVAGPGLAKSATQPQWIFTSVESLFLQAEAAQRGWLTGVAAQTAYENAVRESFIWLGVTNATATANAYIASANPLVNWAAATDKTRLIAMQRYLALPGINNFEAYVDYRRLGVPADLPLSLNPSRGTNVIPLRLQYPQNEYNYNSAVVAAEGAINPQTSTIFWDK